MDQVFSFITELLDRYQLVAGGLFVTLAGVVLAYAKTAPGNVLSFLQKYSFVSVQIDEKDDLYPLATMWLDKNFNPRHDFLAISDTSVDRGPDLKVDPSSLSSGFLLVPAPGTHFGWFRKTPMWFSLQRQQGSDNKSNFFKGDTYTFRFLTWSGCDVVKSFLSECKGFAPKSNRPPIRIAEDSHWSLLGEGSQRPLDSVILPAGEGQELLQDVRKFLSSRQWYVERGIPYRRGYLLYGPPGNGKSSLAAALASELGLAIYILPLSETSLVDDIRLIHLLHKTVEGSIILIEDVDAIFNQDRTAKGRLSFPGFINAIDGVYAQQGRMIIMTTNHIDRLDEALIRSGRIDRRIEIRKPGQEQVETLFDRFFPSASRSERGRIVNQLMATQPSMADIQRALMHLYQEKEGVCANDYFRLQEDCSQVNARV